jgi:hypothetical protein
MPSVAELVAERAALIATIRETDPPGDAAGRARFAECRLRIRTIDATITGSVATTVDEVIAQLRFLPVLYHPDRPWSDRVAADELIERLVAGVSRIMAPPG